MKPRTVYSLCFGISILVAVLYTWSAFAQQPQQNLESSLRPAMQRKLDASKMLLEGLAVEDFEKISKSAQTLSLLSLESSWNVLTTEEYLNKSADFRQTLERIRTASKAGNLDRAALGYIDLTISCVDCHQYMRESK